MKKRFLFYSYLIGIVSGSISHIMAADDTSIIGQKGIIQVVPLVQNWSDPDGKNLTETSIPVYAYFPFSSKWSMSLYVSQASVSSDLNKDFKGITDTQLNTSYHLENMNAVIHFGVNVPTGRKKLSMDEFITSYQISLNQYNFAVPNFGQGFNLAPGISWARPIKDNIVFGAGISYQYRGPFEPFANMTGSYDPGDEILVTGGLDFRLTETSTFSTDLIWTSYGADRLNGELNYQSGNKIIISAQYRTYIQYNELWFFIRYRSKDKNQVAIAGGMVEEAEKSIPDQTELFGQYRIRLKKRTTLSIFADGRFFNETSLFPRTNIIGIGLALEHTLSERYMLPVRLKYMSCDMDQSTLSGLEVGLGIVASL